MDDSKIDGMPSELLALLDRSDLVPEEVVEHNERKGRWCLTCRDADDARLFVKWNASGGAFEEHRLLLEKEKEAYRLLSPLGLCPSLREEHPLFAVEHLGDIETLRSVLLEGPTDEAARMCSDALDAWARALSALREIPLSAGSDSVELVERYQASLAYSGPWDTRDGAAVELAKKLRRKAFWLCEGKRIESVVLARSSRVPVHGDLHLNNIVRGEKGKPLLIDFENIRYGSAEVELAYLGAQIWALGRNSPAVMAALDEKACEFEQSGLIGRELYECVSKLLMWTVSANERFMAPGSPVSTGERRQLRRDFEGLLDGMEI